MTHRKSLSLDSLQLIAAHCNWLSCPWLTPSADSSENIILQIRAHDSVSIPWLIATLSNALPSPLIFMIQHAHTLQHTLTHQNTLQHTATHCNTLQHTATHCNTWQHTATHDSVSIPWLIATLYHATRCNTLTQLVATISRNSLQHFASPVTPLTHEDTGTLC